MIHAPIAHPEHVHVGQVAGEMGEGHDHASLDIGQRHARRRMIDDQALGRAGA
jgi:hypothetical protein